MIGTVFLALALATASFADELHDAEIMLFKEILSSATYDGPVLSSKTKPESRIATDLEYEIKLNVAQTIAYRGYPVVEYKVETTDGYILTLYRIPGPRGTSGSSPSNKVVFLQHGLLDSAFTWVCNFPHQSLAFILADAGYDVWLGNVRGNTYSRTHKTLTPKKNAFWDFSYDEMGYKDVPAMLNYVLGVTQRSSLSYVGHSQGGMVGYIAFSQYPDLAAKINVFIALAPATNIYNAKGGFRLMAPFAGMIDSFFQVFFNGEFLPNTAFVEWAAEHVCAEESFLSTICTSVIFIFAGYDDLHINETRLPVYVSKSPAGTSSKNAVHFSQGLSADRWARFDYGSRDNKKIYGQSEPPEYDISKMIVPTAVFYSTADWLVTKVDVERYLLPRVKNLVYFKDYIDFQHLDFTWGKDAYVTMYKEVLDLVKKYNGV